LINGDGCSSTCTVETGWQCNGASVCIPICGDGLNVGSEVCDDGNLVGTSYCDSSCASASPGYICTGGDALNP